jgi:hypothetical protein
LLLLIAVVLVALVPQANVQAQAYPDSKGTDFWFALMPNFHNFYDSLATRPDLRLQHELYIYIGAEQPTTGTIVLKDALGVERVQPFSIPDPSKLYEFRTYVIPYELVGWNRSLLIDFVNMQTETVAEQTVHISASSDVTVYAANQAVTTSEAFLVLPTDALAEDYVVASYTSDIDWEAIFNRTPQPQSTPSQFCVVATEDNTVITIKPTAATFASPQMQLQTVTMDRGQVYMVQVDPRVSTTADLTGSVIRSNKPVAVFGGHQRALIPIEDQTFLGSRDCLIEQMNPIRTWGKSAFIFPLALSSDEVTNSTSRFRVVAAFDSTKVIVDDVQVAELKRGTFYEGTLDRATEVRSSRPTMVAMLKKTAGPTGLNTSRLGDPFMMLVPPAEQFMDKYRFVNIQAYEYSIENGVVKQGKPVYTEQWLSIVIPTAQAASLVMDGAPLTGMSFAPMGNTGYSWGSKRMVDGIHAISADTNFGIYVYGYGIANSYGYVGGMAFRPLDVEPPTIVGQAKCGVFRGVMADSVLGDTRIKEARLLPGSEQNVVVNILPYSPPVPTVSFTATLINPYADGAFAVEATDNVRQVSSAVFDVPGFTIGAVGQGSIDTLVDASGIIPLRQRRCDTVELENYGKFPHTITRMFTANGATITEPSLPVVIQPGARVQVVVCRQIPIPGIHEDTLFVSDSCLLRPTYRIITDVRADEEPPYTQLSADPCNPEHLLTIGDDRAYDYGIFYTEVWDSALVNCTVELVDESVPIHHYRVAVTDPLFDAIYGIHAVDSARNERWLLDTIPGFTLALEGEGGFFSSHSVPDTDVGQVFCDSVWLSNYGLFPQTVNDVRVRGNVIFSVPSSQLPITIAPGGRMPLLVCYEATHASEVAEADTLEFTDGCLEKLLEVRGQGSTVIYGGLSRCNVLIKSEVHGTGPLGTWPFPATDALYVRTSAATATLHIRILDVQGALVSQHTWRGAPSQHFQLDVSRHPPGTYLLIATLENGTETSTIQIR